MSLFRGWMNGRAWLLWAAPLLVGGTLLWQRISSVGPKVHVVAQANIAKRGPPAGISATEWDAAREEFAGLTDSTLRCGVEEMPAYWRLLKWSVRQSSGEGNANRFSRVAFNDLVNRPSTMRGAAVQVDLHICRIVSYAAPENCLGIEQLYEVWGWSEDSRGSLYVAVTPALPAGMHVGDTLDERASLCGYFYKLQGYFAAGTAAQATPAAAPLIIGQMVRWQPPAIMVAESNEIWFTAGGLVLVASFMWLISQRPASDRGRRGHLAPLATAKLETWLDSNPVVAEA